MPDAARRRRRRLLAASPVERARRARGRATASSTSTCRSTSTRPTLPLPVGCPTAFPKPRPGWCSTPAPRDGPGMWERTVELVPAPRRARCSSRGRARSCNSTETCRAMIAEVPGLRLLVDTGHVADWGGDPLELLDLRRARAAAPGQAGRRPRCTSTTRPASSTSRRCSAGSTSSATRAASASSTSTSPSTAGRSTTRSGTRSRCASSCCRCWADHGGRAGRDRRRHRVRDPRARARAARGRVRRWRRSSGATPSARRGAPSASGCPGVSSISMPRSAIPGVVAATIATPPSTHAELAIAVVGAGKHVLCEKPFAMDAREAESMLAAAERAGVTHLVGHEFRWAPERATAARAIADGMVGDPRLATFVQYVPLVADPESAHAAVVVRCARGRRVARRVRVARGRPDPGVARRDHRCERDARGRVEPRGRRRGHVHRSASGRPAAPRACSSRPRPRGARWRASTRVAGTAGTLWLEGDEVWLADRDGTRRLEVPADLALPAGPEASDDPRHRFTHLELGPVHAPLRGAPRGRRGAPLPDAVPVPDLRRRPRRHAGPRRHPRQRRARRLRDAFLRLIIAPQERLSMMRGSGATMSLRNARRVPAPTRGCRSGRGGCGRRRALGGAGPGGAPGGRSGRRPSATTCSGSASSARQLVGAGGRQRRERGAEAERVRREQQVLHRGEDRRRQGRGVAALGVGRDHDQHGRGAVPTARDPVVDVGEEPGLESVLREARARRRPTPAR